MSEHKFRINISTEQFAPNAYTRNYYFATILLILTLTALAIAVQPYLPSRVPLFYTQPWGESRLANKLYLLILPLLALLFTMINLVIGRFVKEEMVLSRAIAVGNLVMTILLFISFVGIVQSII